MSLDARRVEDTRVASLPTTLRLDETSPLASFERRKYPYGRAKQVAFAVEPKFAAADKLPEPPRSPEGCLGPCQAFGWCH